MSYADAAKKGMNKPDPGAKKPAAKPAAKSTSSSSEKKAPEPAPAGRGKVTRATNLSRARKCQELLPEADKAYANDKAHPIEKNTDYAWYYNECKRKGTPIPNGPEPVKKERVRGARM